MQVYPEQHRERSPVVGQTYVLISYDINPSQVAYIFDYTEAVDRAFADPDAWDGFCGLVTRLCDDGLVERLPDPVDGRVTRAAITGAGHAHIDALRDLQRINSHLIAASAYPVLERQGGLLPSRLASPE